MPTFKLATWNVENFFRPAATADAQDRQRFQRKVSMLANVIEQLDSDVVALQETGGEDAIHDLQQALEGTYPHRAISPSPDARGIRVAFLSRHAFVEAPEDIRTFPPGPALAIHDLTSTGGTQPVVRMGRGALRIRIAKGGRTVDVITAHLKSKLLSFTRPGGTSFTPRNEEERAQVAGIALMRRMAEAVTLRIRINELLSGNAQNALVLLGDFNDVPDAQTSLVLNGPPGSEIATAGFNRPDQGDDARLYSLAPLIPAERRFSRVHRGRRELLDQIYASEELFPVGPNNVRRLPEVDSHVDFSGQLSSVGDNPGQRAAEVAPDHAPVSAKFDL